MTGHTVPLLLRFINFCRLKYASKQALLEETKTMLIFATPIVLSQVGFMLLSSVDSAMIGSLGAAELAGSAIGKAIFWPVSVFAMGIIYVTDAFTARAVGASRSDQLAMIFPTCMNITMWLSIIITPILYFFGHHMDLLGMDKKITFFAGMYLRTACIGLPFLLFATAIQRFWQCQKITLPFLFVLLPINILNFCFNEIFIFGRLGFPALGVQGAALSTSLSRSIICLSTVAISIYYFRQKNVSILENLKNILRPDNVLRKKILRLGFPSGAQLSFEVSVFSLFTILAAWLTITEAAAHQTLMLIISFCYMFPLGLANACSFRVGHLLGSGHIEMARMAGFSAIFIGLLCMAVSALTLLVIPRSLLGIFINDMDVIDTAAQIVAFAAFFQILDAIQGASVGALRGAGNTFFSFIASFIGYYPIALGIGSTLCFYFGMGLKGLWIGMCLGMFTIATLVLNYWVSFRPEAALLSNETALEQNLH